jgi:hypothetical protein
MLIHLNSEIKIDKSQTKKVQKIKISHNYCAFTFANILLVAFTFSINRKYKKNGKLCTNFYSY